MVITKPFKVLVYLAIAWFIALGLSQQSRANPGLSGGVGMSGEALSADQALQPGYQSLPRLPSSTLQSQGSSRSTQTRYQSPSSGSGRVAYGPGSDLSVSAPPPLAYSQSGQVCGPDGCPAPGYGTGSLLPPFASNLFASGVPLGGPYCGPVLPRIGFRQFNLNAKLWNAKLNASTIRWGANPIGGRGTDLDYVNDLGFGKYKYIPEYEARYQIRPNWGIRFSFMPFRYQDNSYPQHGFWFGNIWYAPFTYTLTKWDRNIYRWDLVYDWYQKPHAVSSVFAGYALYDDKLTISQAIPFWTRTRSSGWGLGFAGLSWERVIRNLGASAASTQCKWSVQFGEGYFGYDGYAAARISVPMECGRFGYVEWGWRWMVLRRDYPSNADVTSLDGCVGTMGFVF